MLTIEKLTVGQVIEAEKNPPITREQLKQYAQASGDLNPLHTDDEFAKKLGLPSAIAHGMLIMGQLGKYANALAGETAIVKQFTMRFGAMTFPNEEISCSAVVKSVSSNEAVIDLYASKDAQQVVGSGQVILAFKGEE